MKTNLSLEERFWQKVDKRGKDDCWNWMAGANDKGYGSFGIGNRRTALAHRISWEIAHGSIPESLQVLHTCDNTACCNPNHLFIGDTLTNMRDRKSKGRYNLHGENNPVSKFSIEDVSRIRKLCETETRTAVAKIYGCSVSAISMIARGITWKSRILDKKRG